MKVGELVQSIQMNEPKVEKSGNRKDEYIKLEQGAILAEAGEEDEFIKCFDNITGKKDALEGSEASTRRRAEVSA